MHCKELFHSTKDQQSHQQEDLKEGSRVGNPDLVRSRKRSRFSRYQQRLAGKTQFWQVLSFTGKWDNEFLNEIGPPPKHERKQPDEKLQLNKRAKGARCRYRQGLKCAELREEINNGIAPSGTSLSFREQELLQFYDSGELLQEANRLTQLSGNGRLHRNDGTWMDIGGSTGGWTRIKCYHWQKPNTQEFLSQPPDHTDNWDQWTSSPTQSNQKQRRM